MNPIVNILMPVYNMSRYVESAIQSALAQSFGDFELLIVDDQSTDATAKIIANFNDPRIKYFRNQQNLGPIKNFNRCLSLANASYLVFLHADDQLLPTMLAKNLALMESDRSLGFTFAACEVIDEQDKILYLNQAAKQDMIWPGHQYYQKHLWSNQALFPTIMIRRACLGQTGFFDENFVYTADWDLWLRLEATGFSVGFQKEPLGRYRVHSQSGTSLLAGLGKTEIEEFRLIKKHLNTIGTNILSLPQQRRLAALYRRRTIRQCYLRSREAFCRGQFRLAADNLRIINLWRCDPRINFDDRFLDRFLSFFSLLGVVIE